MDSSAVASSVQYGPSRGVAIAARASGETSRVFKVWPEVGDPFGFEGFLVVQPRDADHWCSAWQVFGIIGSVGVMGVVWIDHAGRIGPERQANLKATSSRK
jgi:hypothetical protein